MNIGSSLYHTIAAIFCRGANGDLLSVEGRDAKIVASHWTQISSTWKASPSSSTTLASGAWISTARLPSSDLPFLHKDSTPQNDIYTIREVFDQTKDCYVGVISCPYPAVTQSEGVFRDWLESFLITATSLSPNASPSSLEDEKSIQITEVITQLFSDHLRNVASKDEWDVGIDLFRRRVLDFVARNARIQMALPAFPCKSPSLSKVGSTEPDLAERIALQTLQDFARKIRQVYPPGVAIWVISDGHVFSDCIGVDDQVISNYDAKIYKMYLSISTSNEDQQDVRFQGLTDMFSANLGSCASIPQQWLDDFQIDHPIKSGCTEEAEYARKIMMAGFQSSREHFRSLISSQDPQTLSLYRGQARFMQEDLSAPDFLEKSPKQRKKASFQVAAEMIARNQAYSNLLEFLLPNFVRLSIHAHNNRGPKFGIRLFSKDKVKAIDSLSDRHELVPAYEFQLPTPWHNSMIKVEGDSLLYLGKASIAHKAIEQGDFEGGWVEDRLNGGHFLLRPTLSICNSSFIPTETTSSTAVSVVSENEKKEAFAVIEEVTAIYAPVRIRWHTRMSRLLRHALSLFRSLVPTVSVTWQKQR